MSPLETLYLSSINRKMLKSKPWVEGVVAAVSCAPEIPMPPKWMPWVFDKATDSSEELDWESVTDALVKTLRDTLSILRNEELPYPEEYTFRPPDPKQSEQAEWLSGFLFAHQALQPIWQKSWECLQNDSMEKAEEAAKTLQHCLKVMSVLADPESLVDKVENTTLLNKLPEIAATLPRTIKQYIELANTLAGYLPNQFEQFTQN